MNLNLLKLLQNREKLTYIERMEEVAVGKALFEILNNALVILREKNENRPQINDDDIPQDFRYIAGQISLVNFILDLPRKANIENTTERGS